MQPSGDVDAFTQHATDAVLVAACAAEGLASNGATLLRHGENAVYRLQKDPIIVRVARNADAPAKEINVASWLRDHGFSATSPARGRRQLRAVNGRLVTWWELIVESPRRPAFTDLAIVMRDLHDLTASMHNVQLPQFEPMPLVLIRLDAARGRLNPDVVEFIEVRQVELRAAYEALSFELERGPIHGDAHLGNLMRREDGTIVLIDFEAFAWGPREWDASVFAAAYAVFGWMDETEYRQCVEAYGWDPLTWDGFHTLRRIRELNMTTWLIQRAGESPEVDEEIARRLADLRDDDRPRRWRQL